MSLLDGVRKCEPLVVRPRENYDAILIQVGLDDLQYWNQYFQGMMN